MSNDYDHSEDKEEANDPVVTADNMQGIIRTIQKNTLCRLSVAVCQFDNAGSTAKSDPRRKEELNPSSLGGDASNSKKNEFFGLMFTKFGALFPIHI